ncbi:N-acetyltransferase [Propionigenium maris DSM 9537]|uniref:N-acetyltransferase n=1 Tax=Propionigenium maris DSM 9537 TaxID=1123000 RepID=A0A9W6GK25_9FUSO|nr:GNAT family N-acetyltransferase [Propionigenium maris]GLI55582.1 N-acetyltransferase [Propionigenium maris DSM 9537]
MIRDAKIEDAQDICGIYNHYIKNTPTTFETERVSEDIMVERIVNISENFFWIVYEKDGRILGYAYASSFKSRSAYNNSVECSIYIRADEKGKGIGSTLLSQLINRCRERGFHTIIGTITLPNEGSIALHEKFGFKKAAHFKEVGYKFNTWIDVGSWQLLL